MNKFTCDRCGETYQTEAEIPEPEEGTALVCDDCIKALRKQSTVH